MDAIAQDPQALAYVGAKPGAVNRNDWYTPEKYLEAARTVLGHIDFDPWSDDFGNQRVKASVYRTVYSPRNWPQGPSGMPLRVWGNPPYGRGLIESAANEWLHYFGSQPCTGILLTNNATETKWWQVLMNEADAVCFTDHRIAFITADQKAVSGNTRGQTFFYFGDAPTRFRNLFCYQGNVMVR